MMLAITNITMLTHGRPTLTEQATKTLRQNTYQPFTLTCFDDQGTMGTGGARNYVIILSEQQHGRGDYLYLSDNDVAFTSGWLDTLIQAYDFARNHLKLAAIGGYCHPFHQPFERHPCTHHYGNEDDPNRDTSLDYVGEIGITWALPTQSMLMTWDVYDRFGPFVDTPPGKVRQSEDWNFTERLRAVGLRVGALYPPVVLPTGRHDTFGELVPEHEWIKDVPGLIVE